MYCTNRYWETVWHRGRSPGLVKFHLVLILGPKGLKQEWLPDLEWKSCEGLVALRGAVTFSLALTQHFSAPSPSSSPFPGSQMYMTVSICGKHSWHRWSLCLHSRDPWPGVILQGGNGTIGEPALLSGLRLILSQQMTKDLAVFSLADCPNWPPGSSLSDNPFDVIYIS